MEITIRRINENAMSPAELAILAAQREVEKLPASELLTEASFLLDTARHAVADWIDHAPSHAEST
jgi:hypothetical protein